MVFTVSTALLLVLAATSAVAQNEIVWGSVIFAYHGEKIPYLFSSSHHLTPLGATQLKDAGNQIRERYIALPVNDSSVADFFQIPGLATNAIVNSQLNLLTPADEVMSASAIAFMQGLYPPSVVLFETEEYQDASGNNGRGGFVSYPLEGYQYPNIKTVNTVTDPASIWIAGHTSCDEYSISEVLYKNTTAYHDRVDSTRSFYHGLRSSVFADVPYLGNNVDYRWANELYEYALFKYNHNSSIYNSPNYTGPHLTTSNFTSADMAMLYNLASEQQFGINTVGNASTIAGQTLASMVVQQLERIIVSGSDQNKLSLMFTSFEPFLSFFALAGLSTGPSAQKFKTLPLHGSMMAFELFSYSNPDDDVTVPPETELYVRFLFRNGTDANAALIPFPLFGHSPSVTELPWYGFLNGIDDFAMHDVATWCKVCATENSFCVQLQNTPSASAPGGGAGSGSISPAVAGAIGVISALVLAALVFIILALLGFRIQRNDRKGKASKSDLGALRVSGANGGFKGAERLPSDTDLRLKGGAGATVIRHERVGSWELNDGPRSPPPVYPNLDKDLDHGRISSTANYGRRSEDDGLERVDPFGDPVRPADQV